MATPMKKDTVQFPGPYNQWTHSASYTLDGEAEIGFIHWRVKVVELVKKRWLLQHRLLGDGVVLRRRLKSWKKMSSSLLQSSLILICLESSVFVHVLCCCGKYQK